MKMKRSLDHELEPKNPPSHAYETYQANQPPLIGITLATSSMMPMPMRPVMRVLLMMLLLMMMRMVVMRAAMRAPVIRASAAIQPAQRRGAAQATQAAQHRGTTVRRSVVGAMATVVLLVLLLLVVMVRESARADGAGDHSTDCAEAAAAEFMACYAADSSAEESGAESTLAAFSASGTFLAGDVPRVGIGTWTRWRAGIAMVVASG